MNKRRCQAINHDLPAFAKLDLASYASCRELAVCIESGSVRPFMFDAIAVLALFPEGANATKRHVDVLRIVATATYAMERAGLVVKHDELGAQIGIKARRTGTVVRELVAWGLLTCTPTFERYGCVSSQRGNAYALGDDLRALLDRFVRPGKTRARRLRSAKQSGYPLSEKSEKNQGSQGLAGNVGSSVAASPGIVPDPGSVPAGSTGAAQPVTRQGANCSSVGSLLHKLEATAPDVDARSSWARGMLDVLADLERGGAS